MGLESLVCMIRDMTLAERRACLRGIPALLASYNWHQQRSCGQKKKMSFNHALLQAVDHFEEDGMPFSIYFCLHCFRYHIGHAPYTSSKEYCAWCGNWIKKGKMDGHLKRCR